MACPGLERLRKEARHIYTQLGEKLKRYQEFSTRAEIRGTPQKTEYEPFLRSQLTQLEAQIRSHIAQHGCE